MGQNEVKKVTFWGWKRRYKMEAKNGRKKGRKGGQNGDINLQRVFAENAQRSAF
jgi:hypothetical protein